MTTKNLLTPAPQVTRTNEAWAIDFVVLDQPGRPRILLVIDIGTRRPLAATVIRAMATDVVATLDSLSQQATLPRELWIDNSLEPALRLWAENHRVAFLSRPTQMPQMKALAEPILRDLAVSVRDKRFQTPTELGKEIERWCRGYAAGSSR